MKWLILLLVLVVHAHSAQAQDCDDAVLSEVAAAVLLDHGAAAGAPSAALLEAALREAGSSLPSAKIIVLAPDGDGRSRERWLEARHSEADGPGVCGEAVGQRRVLVFGVRAGSLRRAGDELIADWDGAFRDAYLVVVNESGGAHALAIPADHRIEMPEGLVRAQLVATGPSGPRPLADWGASNLPALPRARTNEQRLALLREAAGVGGLRPNRLLAQAAQRHAQDVCQQRRARHVFDSWPAERMRRLGLRARHLGETVARASSVDGALEALAQSPSHRMALVDRRFTDVGLGVVRSRGESCVVVFLAAWPQAIAY
ncbi:MAG: hypothetical protein ACI9KE_003830 [Polyangiales bacterium]